MEGCLQADRNSGKTSGKAIDPMHEFVLRETDFNRFRRYVYDASGIDLHEGKKELLRARLTRIIRDRGYGSFREYFDRLVRDHTGAEKRDLLDAISTNLTYFFREPRHLDFLVKTAIPRIMEKRRPGDGGSLRIWSAGCSSGEEPYSIAISICEAADGTWAGRFRILATDLSTRALSAATSGIYKEKKLEQVPLHARRRYFQKGVGRWEGCYRIKREIRDKIRFSRLNLQGDFRFRRPLDVIFCRNVMIYFDPPTKERLVGKFFRSLGTGGYLFIGHAESLTGLTHRFRYVRPGIYRKT